jgi:type I restriction enzyme S subunit
VHLRFPGHEISPRRDGIPEGWTQSTFAELAHINPRTSFPKDVERPFVEMSSLSETAMVIGSRSTRCIGGGAKFRNGDTLFARITPCLENGKTGYVQFLEDEEAVASGSTEFIVFRSRHVNPWWVYCAAREDRFREHAIRSMSGADGRQRVSPECFDKFEVLRPPQDVLDQFGGIVADSFTLIEQLCCQNQKLAAARDMLLPKLMSGQLDVSGIRLPEEIAA